MVRIFYDSDVRSTNTVFPQIVSTNSFRGNYSFLNVWIVEILNTVFPRIVSAETILFGKLQCGNYSKEETIQGRKVLICCFFVSIYDLNTCRTPNSKNEYFPRNLFANYSTCCTYFRFCSFNNSFQLAIKH